jgi:phosphoglycolate phosphatase-like HAD superfamily hydrolase
VTPRFDLVIFDIDGTLLATDAFWLEIGTAAVAAVCRRHGLPEDPPPRARFLEAMGLPMRAFWQHVLPPDLHARLEEIEAEAQELEKIAFAKGHGAMYPGARALLDELHLAGVRLALASNCGRRYLDGFVASFGLRDIVQEAYCAETPGIGSKTDMLREILAVVPARRAVMVGDRDGDRQAARANRIAFVLFTGGFSAPPASDGDGAAATFEELRALLLG